MDTTSHRQDMEGLPAMSCLACRYDNIHRAYVAI